MNKFLRFWEFEGLSLRVWVWDPIPVYWLQNSSGHGTKNISKFREQTPNHLNKYTIISVARYDKNSGLVKGFHWLLTEKDYLLRILRDIDTTKAAVTDSLPGRFFKAGADVVALPITIICNLGINSHVPWIWQR